MKTDSEIYDDTKEAIRAFKTVYGDRTSIDDDMLTVETVDDILNKEQKVL